MRSITNISGFGRQCGSALIVSLILLMVLTMLAVQGMRTNIMQERMAGNMRDRNLAFQAAEAALRVGERQLNDGVIAGGGMLGDPRSWDGDVVNSVPTPASGGLLANFDVSLAQQPTFYVGERLYYDDIDGTPDSSWCPHVVTAHGAGGSADTQVILQAYFLPRAGNCN